MATTSAQVQQLYVAYLGRAADKAGLDYWLNELNAENATLTLENLRANFVNEQPEYAAIYGGLTREDTVVKIYNNLFGRAPDAAGLEYWTTGGGASVNADLLLTAFVNGAATTDAQVVANKVLVSEVYTSTAGDQFSAADAAAIIADVDGTNASIATALDKLTDGSLSGIAVPAAVGALKADAAADAALANFESTKAADLTALSKELATLSTTGDKAGVIGDVTASTATTYGALKTAVEAAIVTAKGTLDTKALTATLATETTTLAEAKTAFLTAATETKAVDKIAAYDAAVKAVAANPGAVAGDKAQAQATLEAYAANSANTATFAAAVKAAGLPDNSTAADVYAKLALSSTTDAQIKSISDAFSGISQFAAVKTQAALDHSANVAKASLATAEGDLTGAEATAWKDAYDAVAETTANLNGSKAVDAFVAKYNAVDAAHEALVVNAGNTQDAVDASTALTAVAANAGTTAKADVFYFAAKVAQTDDFAINFGAKDSLYLGEGYTLNTAGTVDATTGHIVGGNNNALEVFFIKDAGVVKAVVETTAFGSSTADLSVAGTNAATDNVAVITLTGVTDVSQVSFANGVISHVA